MSRNKTIYEVRPRKVMLKLQRRRSPHGRTMDDLVHDGVAEWLARREAEKERPGKLSDSARTNVFCSWAQLFS